MSFPAPSTQPASPPVSRRAWTVLAIVSVAVFLFVLDRQMLALLKTTMKERLGWSDGDYALLASAFLVSFPAGQLLAGWLAQRWGTVRIAMGSIALMSLATVASGAATDLGQMLAARSVLGLAEGGVLVTAITGIARWFPVERRATAYSIKTVVSSMAYITGPAIAASLAGAIDWRAAFFVPGLAGLLLPWLWWRWDRDPPALGADSPAAAHEAPARWTDLVRHRGLRTILVARVLGDPLWIFYANWQPGYLQEGLGLTLAELGAWAWIPPAVAGGASLLGGIVSDRLVRGGRTGGRGRIQVMQAVAVLGLASWLLPLTHNLWVTLAVFAAIHVLYVQWGNLTETLLSEIMPREWLGPGLAYFSVVIGLLSALMNLLIGWTIGRLGYAPVFWVAGALPLASAVWLHIRFRSPPTTPAAG